MNQNQTTQPNAADADERPTQTQPPPRSLPTIDLDADQQRAVERCCDMGHKNRVAAVTGIAGTGKTTIMRIVYQTLTEAGYTVALAAPTGKAAKRINEVTGIPAMTIHRLLEFPRPNERDPKTGRYLDPSIPKRDRSNPLNSDVVMVDEYSMVNRTLHADLVAAVPRGGRILMFGDYNQLQPIESVAVYRKKPSPFRVAIERFDGVVLTHNHRQGAGSGIADNGARVLIGRMPQRRDDFAIINTERPVDSLRKWVEERAAEGKNFGAIEYQILTTTKKSWIGTYQLNTLLQGIINPRPAKERIKVPRAQWEEREPIWVAVGDKVIWTENAYDLRDDEEAITQGGGHSPVPPNKYIFNGETGVIVDITDTGDIAINVGDRIVDVPCSQIVYSRKKKDFIEYDPRARMSLGYALTTHKAQGSEYIESVYILNKSTRFMQCRPNLYTAITRPREHSCIMTDARSLQHSVVHVMSMMDRKDN